MELWFNVKGRRWEEVSSCGEEGTQGGSESVANEIVCANLGYGAGLSGPKTS